MKCLSVLAVAISMCSLVYIHKINNEFAIAIVNTSTMHYNTSIEVSKLKLEIKELKTKLKQLHNKKKYRWKGLIYTP